MNAKESFIHARLVEHFGHEDIEGWLARERVGEKQKGSGRVWKDLIKTGKIMLVASFHLPMLSKLARPSSVQLMREEVADDGEPTDACYLVIAAMQEDQVEVYCASMDLHVIVRKSQVVPWQAVAIRANDREVLRNPEDPVYQLRLATTQDCLRVVFELGLMESHRGRKNRARKFLCDALAETIKGVRAEAEKSFDTSK